jgi:RsiW-degrading membrane proteinase PrsW (M82 family)
MIRSTSLAERLRIFLILWIFIGALYILPYLFVFFVYPFYEMLLIIVGLMTGMAFGYFFEKRQLRIIEEKGENRMTRSYTLTVIAVLVGAAIVSFALLLLFLPASIWWNWPLWRLIGGFGFTLLAPIAPAMFEARILMIKKWQRKNQKEIFNDSGFLTSRLYAVPQQNYAS